MPEIKFTEVLSYSSEDPNHPADNLLRPDRFRKWKCARDISEKHSFVILKFEKLTCVNFLDIGNEGSALIEVLVSREGLSDYQVLVVSSSFMTPAESRNGTDLNRVRMFGPDKLVKKVAEQKWDRVKVICTQPFNTEMQYGLSFIVARSADDKQQSPQKITQLGSFKLKMDDDCDTISIGSMFAKRNEKTQLSSTGPAAIRAASREAAAAAAASPSGTQKRKDQSSDEASIQLKKKAATESTRSPMSKPSPSTAHGSQNTKKHNEKQRKTDSKPERKEGKHSTPKNSGREEKEKKKENKPKHKGNSDDRPSHSKTDTQDTDKKRRSKPFTSLMDDVVFVMSGYQNPERSNLRDKLTEMGGQYKSDWSPGCTHLICAFINTPKYRQIKGKGKIVTASWITDCYKKKIRYPWRRYGLEKRSDGSESEEEIWAEELLPKESKPKATEVTPSASTNLSDAQEDSNYSDDEDTDDEIQKILDRQQGSNDLSSGSATNSSNKPEKENPRLSSDMVQPMTTNQHEKDDVKNGHGSESRHSEIKHSSTSNGFKNCSDEEVYDDDTDIDEDPPDTSSLPLPELGDYFKGKYFFLYSEMSEEKRKLITRYIIAYNGKIADYMSENVSFVLSDSEWDENFEEALNDNPALQFVKVQWLWQCCDKKKLVPHQPYLIVPK